MARLGARKHFLVTAPAGRHPPPDQVYPDVRLGPANRRWVADQPSHRLPLELTSAPDRELIANQGGFRHDGYQPPRRSVPRHVDSPQYEVRDIPATVTCATMRIEGISRFSVVLEGSFSMESRDFLDRTGSSSRFNKDRRPCITPFIYTRLAGCEILDLKSFFCLTLGITRRQTMPFCPE
jgi:hypothetical protein